MKPDELRTSLKKWMERNQKKAVDVAAISHVSQRTVERFLEGVTIPRPIVMDAFRKVLEQDGPAASN